MIEDVLPVLWWWRHGRLNPLSGCFGLVVRTSAGRVPQAGIPTGVNRGVIEDTCRCTVPGDRATPPVLRRGRGPEHAHGRSPGPGDGTRSVLGVIAPATPSPVSSFMGVSEPAPRREKGLGLLRFTSLVDAGLATPERLRIITWLSSLRSINTKSCARSPRSPSVWP
jgi:hypothetical protein